jgi:CRP-like cAMP-binding protein
MPIETFGKVDAVTEAAVEADTPFYWIWGVDNVPYGPVELPALVSWVKEERVISSTWVYVQETSKWLKASEVPELKMFFQKKASSSQADESLAAAGLSNVTIKPGALRRIKIFADLDDDQLMGFLNFMETLQIRPGVHIVQKGETSGAMYLVLEGELRSSLRVDGKETPIATLAPGSIFGEISLLDRGANTADVISNQESLLIRISGESFDRVTREAPQMALPFLLCLSKAIAGRVRNLTKRYEDSVLLSQTAPLPSAVAQAA